MENAKKLKPSDDGVVPGNLGIGTVPVPPITIPTTIPATSTVTTTTTAIPTHIRGIPAFHGYPLAYPVQDDDKIIKTNSGHEINLSYWTDLIKLGMAFVQCNQKCHLDLKYKLVPAAKELANRDQSLGPELFGENLKEHYKQIQEVADNFCHI